MASTAPADGSGFVMPHIVAATGLWPNEGAGGALFTLGMIHGFAGIHQSWGAPLADGRLLDREQWSVLFDLYGTRFGGDANGFALPDLRGGVAVGGGPGTPAPAGAVALTYLIAAAPGSAALPAGLVTLFGGDQVPAGWLACDGGEHAQSDFPVLFAAIGTVFGGGGDGFAVPDLRGTAVIGAGAAPGLAPVALGQRVDGPVPALGLNHILRGSGLFPSIDALERGEFDLREPYIGEVFAYAGASPPQYWAACDGSLLPIGPGTGLENQAIFSLLGTTYGGDGMHDFALPDLRGQMIGLSN